MVLRPQASEKVGRRCRGVRTTLAGRRKNGGIVTVYLVSRSSNCLIKGRGVVQPEEMVRVCGLVFLLYRRCNSSSFAFLHATIRPIAT